MELLPAVIRIEDYKLEEMLRCPEQFASMHEGRKREGDVNWRQLTQFAASHVVNDFYMLPIEARMPEAVEALVERRWTNRHYKFLSGEHYLQMKRTVVENLALFLLGGACAETPILTFEQLTPYVEELDMELSQIFHAIAGDGSGDAGGYIVQKFAVDADREALTLFFHMTSVVCMNAFERLPSRIEVLSVLEGKRLSFVPTEASLEQSYDYMYLIKSLLPEADAFKVNPGRDVPFCS